MSFALALLRRQAYSACLPSLRHFSPMAEVAAAGPAGWTAASVATAGPPGGGSLAERYAALVAAGTLKPDPHQAACVQRLERLSHELRLHTQQASNWGHRSLCAGPPGALPPVPRPPDFLAGAAAAPAAAPSTHRTPMSCILAVCAGGGLPQRACCPPAAAAGAAGAANG